MMTASSGGSADGDGHGLEAARAGEAQRRGALAPHRVGEDAAAVDLDEHGRVSEPGGAQA
jgi:hypothetical protein